MEQQQRQHFLLVAYPVQGHLNPALQLAKRLTRANALVTFATTISGQRRMFSSSNPAGCREGAEQQQEAPLLSFSPYSDGYDDGFDKTKHDAAHYMSQTKVVGSETLARVARSLAEQGRPVTCVVYTTLLPWAADVARELGVQSVLFWIQPATVFAAYYHYFHGYADLIVSHGRDPWFTVELPGIPSLRIRDLPSFLIPSKTSDDYSFKILPSFEEMYRTLDREVEETKKGSLEKKSKVLVNTFDELEHEQLSAVDTMELIPIGPLLPSAYTDGKDSMDTAFGNDLLQPDAIEQYMEWLDAKPDRSVVYVSFGSRSVLPIRQNQEISRALAESGQHYLWAVRGNREGVEEGAKGKLVDWCSQLEVLSHRAVGCFVTHCGWNSMVESLVCGVPTVGAPQWTDQLTSARLAEAAWGTGARAEVNAEGLLEACELRRCLDLVMGVGERSEEIGRNAGAWRDKARGAVKEGGSSDRNLKAFLEELSENILTAPSINSL